MPKVASGAVPIFDVLDKVCPADCYRYTRGVPALPWKEFPGNGKVGKMLVSSIFSSGFWGNGGEHDYGHHHEYQRGYYYNYYPGYYRRWGRDCDRRWWRN
jgi:hypothetical protein